MRTTPNLLALVIVAALFALLAMAPAMVSVFAAEATGTIGTTPDASSSTCQGNLCGNVGPSGTQSCGDGTCNNGETCSSCATDCGVCSSGGGGSASAASTGGAFLPDQTDDEQDLTTANTLLANAKSELAKGNSTGAQALADQAEALMQGVRTGMDAAWLIISDELWLTAIPELGLTAEDIAKGKLLLDETKALLAQAASETDMATRIELLIQADAKLREALQLLPEAKLIQEAKQTRDMTIEGLDAAKDYATGDALDYLLGLRSRIGMLQKLGHLGKSMKVYLITNKERDSTATTYRSKIFMVLEGKLDGASIIEVVPKDVAADVAALFFKDVPATMQADPIFWWSLGDLDGSAERAYVVGKRLTSLDTIAFFDGTIPKESQTQGCNNDNVCDPWETEDNCPADCGVVPLPETEPQTPMEKAKGLAGDIITVLLIVLVIFGMVYWIVHKNHPKTNGEA
ncbi:hypothetical protein AUJ68_02060 [Candidatus Woesearchaeota archaeon CG1_02_57_44]|nr:MAG: hypothetical protein AUJ68_02060 [Candidatus Woesearchaeota archaeon CG1_02_57_44]